MTKFSIIVPTYNVEAYIEKCITSVLSQSNSDFELLLVDDCSSDTTVSIINSYSDKRIKLFQNSSNKGPSHSRNIGIENACGEYITFLDGDDWWEHNRLDMLWNYIGSKESLDLVWDDLFFIEDNSLKPWTTFTKQKKINWNMPKKVDITTFIKIDLGLLKPTIKREFITNNKVKFNETVRYGEDFLFFLEMLLKGAEAFFYPKPLYYYRSRPNSLVTQKGDSLTQMIEETNNLIKCNHKKLDPIIIKALKQRKTILNDNLKFWNIQNQLKDKQVINCVKQIIKYPKIFIIVLEKSLNYISKKIERSKYS
ncbi:glycosyltransferase family 2 protein [Priestia megaterium]